MDSKKDKHKFKLFGAKEAGKPPKDKEGRRMTESQSSILVEISSLSNEEIDRQLAVMFEDMNLPPEQTKALLAKPMPLKIEMLINHKASQISSKNSDPDYFANILRNHQNYSPKQLQHTLDELLIKLRSSVVSWNKTFDDSANDGLNCLLRFLALALTGFYPTCGLACLRCIRMFGNCGYGMLSLVNHETASTFIARCLDSNLTSMMDCAIELLSSIALSSAKGYQKVIEGLTYSAELANSPGDRFVPLLKALDNPELARASLQLINVLVNHSCLSDSSFDVDYRIHLRLELNKLGIGYKIENLAKSTDPVILNHVSIYQRKAEEDADLLFDRLDAVKCDLDDSNQVFQILYRTLAGTKSESKFISILQHLLFVRDEPSRFAYFAVLEDLVSQVVMQVDGFDPDPRSVLLRLDVEATVAALLEQFKETETAPRDSELQKRLDQALQEKLEAEATILTLQKQLEVNGIATDGKVKVPEGLEDKLRPPIPPPPPIPGGGIPPPPPLPGIGIPPPPPLPGAGIPPPPPIPGGGIPPPPPLSGGGVPSPPSFGNSVPPPLISKTPSQIVLPFGMKPKKKYTPDAPMKKANWDKIGADVLSEESVWVHLNEYEIESSELFDSLKSQFTTKPSKKLAPDISDGTSSSGGSGTGGVTSKKVKSLRFLDGKTAQNLSILLSSLKASHSEIRRRLIMVDETLLTVHMVEQLLKALPEQSIINQIVEAKTDYDNLAEPEQFICQVGTIKKLIPRLHAILFKLRFDEKRDEIKPDIVDADEALREIHCSKHLRRILELVLLLGNYMNAGSRNAESLGFQVSFLAKLESTKDVSNQQTLLHFMADYLDKKYPETARGILTDLSHIDRACRFSEDNAKSTIAEMKKTLSGIETELRTYKSQEPDDAYQTVMQEFVTTSKVQLNQLEAMFERMKERFLVVSKYFAFNPTKYHMEDLFADVKAFHSAYGRAAADIAKRRALEERQKKAAEEQDRRNRDRLQKSQQAGGARRGPSEEEDNVIDNLMEALKSGAAFADSGRTGGARRPRSRVTPSVMNPTTPSHRERIRDRSRNFDDRLPTVVNVA